MIENIRKLVIKLGGDGLNQQQKEKLNNAGNAVKALAAFCAGHIGGIDLEKSDTKQSASRILAQVLSVPSDLIEGIHYTASLCQERVKKCILNLINTQELKVDENIARALISLATGEVDCIEDLASQLSVDEDVGEGLAFIASSVTLALNYAELRSSSSLLKLCDKMGLDPVTVAGLLAIVNQDILHGHEINRDLSLVDIDGRYLTAFMGVYHDEFPNEPKRKTKILVECFKPLASLYGIPASQSKCAALWLRLLQGDATVIREELGSYMGWSSVERDCVCALVILVQRNFELDWSPEEPVDWDAKRDACVACSIVSRYLGFSKCVFELLIKASRGESLALLQVADMMKLNSNCSSRSAIVKARDAIDEIIDNCTETEYNPLHHLQDDDVEDDAQSLASASSSRRSSLLSSSNYLGKLTLALNKKIVSHDDLPEMTEDDVSWILTLAVDWRDPGDGEYIDNYVAKIRKGESTPCLTTSILKQILAFSMSDETFLSDVIASTPDAGGAFVHCFGSKRPDSEDSIMNTAFSLSLSPSIVLDPGLSLIIRLANKSDKAWDIRNADGVISSKIHPDTRLVKAFSALASNTVHRTKSCFNTLCNELAVNAEMVTTIIGIAIGETDNLKVYAQKIARRIGQNENMTMAFVAGATLDEGVVLELLSPAMDKLYIKADLATNLVLAVQCWGDKSISAWENIGKYIRSVKDVNEVPLYSKNEIEKRLSNRRESFIKGLGQEKIQHGLNGDVDLIFKNYDFETNRKNTKLWIVKTFSAIARSDLLKFHEFSFDLDKAIYLDSLNGLHFTQDVQTFSRIVLAIARNETSILKHTLKLLSFQDKDIKVAAMFVNAFNRSPGSMADDVPSLDKLLVERCAFPPGVFKAFCACLVRNLDKFADGISSACCKSDIPTNKYSGTTWKDAYIGDEKCGLAHLFVSIQRRDTFLQTKEKQRATLELFNTLLNQCHSEASITLETSDFVYSLLLGHMPGILQSCKHFFGIDPALASDICHMAAHKCTNESADGPPFAALAANILEWSQQMDRANDLDKQLYNADDTMQLWCTLLGSDYKNLGEGRKGVSVCLNRLTRYILDSNELCDMIDAVFLATLDAPTHMDLIKKHLPCMAQMVVSGTSDKLNDLMMGIVDLCAPRDTKDKQDAAFDQAVTRFSSAFHVPVSAVKGIFALARGEIMLMEDMAIEIGEFEPSLIMDVFRIIRQLAPIVSDIHPNQEGSSTETNKGEEDSSSKIKSSSSSQDKDVMDRHALFRHFDTDNTGYLDLSEFREVVKFYKLELSFHRTLELFSEFDFDGDALLGEQEFEEIMLHIEHRLVEDIVSNKMGKSAKALGLAFLFTTSTMLFLFLFIFMGIDGFGNHNTFDSVVNSILPATIGKFVEPAKSDEDATERDSSAIVEKVSAAFADLQVQV